MFNTATNSGGTFQFVFSFSSLFGHSVLVIKYPAIATKKRPTTLGARAETSKFIIPPNATNKIKPNDMMNATRRKIHLSALMKREELLLILFVRSYKSIQVTPISKSIITLNGIKKYVKKMVLE